MRSENTVYDRYERSALLEPTRYICKCPACNGKGSVLEFTDSDGDWYMDCPSCNGTGETIEEA